MVPARVVVLASGDGSTLQAIIDACIDADYGVRLVAVGADRVGSRAQSRAEDSGIPTWIERVEDHAARADFDEAVAMRLREHRPDLVVLAGYMKILGPAVVDHFRCVNTHPALLPKFPGGHAIRDALAAGESETGATVHWVDRGVDTGPVLAQVKVPIEPGDDEATLRARIQAAERPLFVAAIGLLARETTLNQTQEVRR